MKQFLFIITAAFILSSCGGNNPTTQTTTATPETPHAKPEHKKVKTEDVLTADELATITGSNQRGGKKQNITNQITLAGETDQLTNNGGGSFTMSYSASNVVWMFFRGGDSLSTSGNVYPTASMSFYQNPVTSITSTFTKTYYQSVVVYGSTTPDANGVIGADWVFKYSNVVQ